MTNLKIHFSHLHTRKLLFWLFIQQSLHSLNIYKALLWGCGSVRGCDTFSCIVPAPLSQGPRPMESCCSWCLKCLCCSEEECWNKPGQKSGRSSSQSETKSKYGLWRTIKKTSKKDTWSLRKCWRCSEEIGKKRKGSYRWCNLSNYVILNTDLTRCHNRHYEKWKIWLSIKDSR